MNFFLSDNTMEVKEVKVSNSAFDSFPMLLNCMRVPKVPIMTHYPNMSLRQEDNYTPSDFMMGNVINIYGRNCLIVDCDEYTKQWYQDQMEIKQIPLKVGKPHKNLKYDPYLLTTDMVAVKIH